MCAAGKPHDDTITPLDEEFATLARALSHPVRVAIVRHLAEAGTCVCGEIVSVMPLAQATVSQHLKVLVQAGLVIYEPTRPRSRYTLNRPVLQEILGAVSGLVDDCCRTGSCQ